MSILDFPYQKITPTNIVRTTNNIKNSIVLSKKGTWIWSLYEEVFLKIVLKERNFVNVIHWICAYFKGNLVFALAPVILEQQQLLWEKARKMLQNH